MNQWHQSWQYAGGNNGAHTQLAGGYADDACEQSTPAYAEQQQPAGRRALPRLPPNCLRAHLPSDELAEEDEAHSERSIPCLHQPQQHPQYQSSYSEQILPYRSASSAARSTEPSDNATYVDEQQLSPSAELPEPADADEPEALDVRPAAAAPATSGRDATLPHQESNASARSDDVTGTEADDERDSLHEQHNPLTPSRSQQPQQQPTLAPSSRPAGQVEGEENEYEDFEQPAEAEEQQQPEPQAEEYEQWLQDGDGDEQLEDYEEPSRGAHGEGERDDLRRRRGNVETQYRREKFRSFRDKHPSTSRSQQQQRPEPQQHPRYPSRSLCDDAGESQLEPEPEPEPELEATPSRPESPNAGLSRDNDGGEPQGSLGDRDQFSHDAESTSQLPYENGDDIGSQQQLNIEPHDSLTQSADTIRVRKHERQSNAAEVYEYADVDVDDADADEQTEEAEALRSRIRSRQWDGNNGDVAEGEGERSPAPMDEEEAEAAGERELEPVADQPEQTEETEKQLPDVSDANEVPPDEADDEFPDDEQEAAGGGAAARWLAAFTKVCENLEVRTRAHTLFLSNREL